MIEVTAAIIQKGTEYLIAQRSKSGHLPEKWEFPGGKIELGETPEFCLARELKEELEIEAIVGKKFHENTHNYKTKMVRLHTYLITSYSGTIKLNNHEQIKWVNLESISKYDFADADIPIVHKLVKEKSCFSPT